MILRLLSPVTVHPSIDHDVIVPSVCLVRSLLDYFKVLLLVSLSPVGRYWGGGIATNI